MIGATKLILEDIRCFEGSQAGRLRPITLLVGENSTGKSTFLGCCSVLHQVLSDWTFEEQLDFNQEPFLMGSFRDIVRSRRRPSDGIDQFVLGIEAVFGRGRRYLLQVAFSELDAQPVVSAFHWRFDAGSYFRAQRDGSGKTMLSTPAETVTIDVPFSDAMFALDYLVADRGRRFPGAESVIKYVAARFPGNRLRRVAMLPRLPELIPVAPLRSKPKRTYDPIREATSADGEHVPMLMMRLDRTDKERWESLHDELVGFGRESGLFSDVRVRRHGRQMSDPFQLQFKVRAGSYANIMDVGYGVSQSLPILVDLMAAEDVRRAGASARRRRAERTYLLQQPEVHLHPRGQAELASLFAASFKRRGNQFLVETHSDHIVDRVRILVRQQVLKPDDVSIIYFEPNGGSVDIHNLTLDVHGNLCDAPPGYRDFFMRETDRLLGFDD